MEHVTIEKPAYQKLVSTAIRYELLKSLFARWQATDDQDRRRDAAKRRKDKNKPWDILDD